MKNNSYITDAEHEKCRKIADIFSMLQEDDIILLDVGIYGFVVLFHHTSAHGFQAVKTFTNSYKMFKFLRDQLFDSQLIRLAHEMNLDGFDYIDIFKMLSDEKKNELKTQMKYFKKIAGF